MTMSSDRMLAFDGPLLFSDGVSAILPVRCSVERFMVTLWLPMLSGNL